MYRLFLLIIFCISHTTSFSQNADSIHVFNKNGIIKPSILSTHPFGIFFSRLQGNFKTRATKAITLKLGLESGNVWAAPVIGYIPNEETIRNQVRETTWHSAEFKFNEEELDAKTIELQFDGVIKGFRVESSFNLGKEHEFNIGLRSYTLSNGKFPFTILTGDEFIESFHENIAGGDDPFGRKLFGLNQAGITYKDINNNTLELNKGDLIFGGIETSYYYYPEKLINKNKTFYVNFGAHLGTNLSKYNASIDLGITTNGVKKYTITERSMLNLGVGFGILRKSLIDLKDDNLEFGNNDFIGNLESIIEYSIISKGGTIHSFGVDFYFQTSLNKKDEFDYLIPIRNGITEKSWVTGISHLYKNNNYWTLMYSFTRKVSTSFYLQQDLTLNNNPDIQTGVSIQFKI